MIVVKKYEQDIGIEYYGEKFSAGNGKPLFVGHVVIPQNEFFEKNEMYRYGEKFSLNYFYSLFKD